MGIKYHLQDFQALHILLERYLTAVTAPTVSRPETACLVLETMTVRLRTFCMHFAASSLEPIKTSRMIRPSILLLKKCYYQFNVGISWNYCLIKSNMVIQLSVTRHSEARFKMNCQNQVFPTTIECTKLGWVQMSSKNTIDKLKFIPDSVSFFVSPSFIPIWLLTIGGRELTRERATDKPQSCYKR